MLRTPEAAPATRGSMFLIATVDMGAKIMPMPSPETMKAGRKSLQVESVLATAMMSPLPTANSSSPRTRMYLPPIRSAIRPASGASGMETRDIGMIARPAWRAVMPSTDWR